MTFEDVRNNCLTGVYATRMARYTPVPETTIFDEDKSVKWNREEAKKQNEIILQDFNTLKKSNQEKIQQFEDDLFSASCSDYKINRSQFNALYERVMMNTEHNYQCVDFVDEFEDFIDFIYSVMNMK